MVINCYGIRLQIRFHIVGHWMLIYCVRKASERSAAMIGVMVCFCVMNYSFDFCCVILIIDHAVCCGVGMFSVRRCLRRWRLTHKMQIALDCPYMHFV